MKIHWPTLSALLFFQVLFQGVTFAGGASAGSVQFSNFIGNNGGLIPAFNTQLGSGWVRLPIEWPSIEASRGAFNWTATDQTILSLQHQGNQLVLDLAYTPGWANGNLGQYYAPTQPSDWTTFVTAVVARYSAAPYGIQYFQVWNEPTATLVNGKLSGYWMISDVAPTNKNYEISADQEFVDQIYIPAAQIIRSYQCEVVFGGWPDGNAVTELTNNVLSYHSAWKYTDYVDVHYFPLSAWQSLYSSWIAPGKIKGIWQSEIGNANNPSGLTTTYLQFLSWALTPYSGSVSGAANGGGWVNSAGVAVNPDMYKLIWYASWGNLASLSMPSTSSPAGYI